MMDTNQGKTIKPQKDGSPVILRRLSDWAPEQVFLELSEFLPPPTSTYLKLEGLSAAGSIKLTTAKGMLDDAERRGELRPGVSIIESSSGNLGIALSMLCSERGYRFICVVDPNASTTHLKTMKALGAELVMVSDRDSNGGYLQSRVDYIACRLASESGLFWPNQYANRANTDAHARRTAHDIRMAFEHVDFLFVGCGTSGTLMGCAEHFAQYSPRTVVVGVDSVGSVTFDGQAGPRHLPGLGASRRPELFDARKVHRLIKTSEADALLMCRSIAKRWGFLAGGSTGSVLAAVNACSAEIPAGSVVVAVSPDMGDRYLDQLYDDDWVDRRFAFSPDIKASFK